MESLTSISSQNLFILCSISLFTFFLVFPWVIVLLVFSTLLGYYSVDFLQSKLVLAQSSSNSDKIELEEEYGCRKEATSDPLLSIPQMEEEKKSLFHKRAKEDLRVNDKLDHALSNFSNCVFDHYVNSSWAPYETRRQLRLALKRLLTSFGEKVNNTFAKNPEEGKLENFVISQIIPLFLHHYQQASRGESNERIANLDLLRLKVRSLARILLIQNMSEEDVNCKMWVELCVSVLGDGVFWNLFQLGKQRLPDILENLYNELKESSGINSQDGNSDEVDSPQMYFINSATTHLSKNEIVIEEKNNVPFLLDGFLDPRHELEQPEFINSRWRPTLSEILGEKDLLYYLIQYLRGKKALEYLQAVLDDTPDGSAYCRQILELELIPGFCRSKLFIESMGLSRIEIGLEAGFESPNTLKTLHIRSASYGGSNTGIPIWKLEKSVVDGLAIYSNDSPDPSISTSVTLPIEGNVEPDFKIRKRPQNIDVIVLKFLNSTTNLYEKIQDPAFSSASRSPVKAKRVGTEARSYEKEDDPSVHSRVSLRPQPFDIFNSSTNIVTSWMDRDPYSGPVTSGWIDFLTPLLKPKFEEELKSLIIALLSTDNLVYLVQLIHETFVEALKEQKIQICQPRPSTPPKIEDWEGTIVKWLLSKRGAFINEQLFFDLLKMNQNSILLFFVDALDFFIAELENSVVL